MPGRTRRSASSKRNVVAERAEVEHPTPAQRVLLSSRPGSADQLVRQLEKSQLPYELVKGGRSAAIDAAVYKGAESTLNALLADLPVNRRREERVRHEVVYQLPQPGEQGGRERLHPLRGFETIRRLLGHELLVPEQAWPSMPENGAEALGWYAATLRQVDTEAREHAWWEQQKHHPFAPKPNVGILPTVDVLNKRAQHVTCTRRTEVRATEERILLDRPEGDPWEATVRDVSIHAVGQLVNQLPHGNHLPAHLPAGIWPAMTQRLAREGLDATRLALVPIWHTVWY